MSQQSGDIPWGNRNVSEPHEEQDQYCCLFYHSLYADPSCLDFPDMPPENWDVDYRIIQELWM